MKRCPECRRDYYDDSLLYCLDDGNALLEGPAFADEPATAIIPAGGLHSGGISERQRFWHKRRASVAGTPQPYAHRAAKPQVNRNRLVGVFGIAIILLIGGFLGYRYLGSSSKQIESIAVLPLVNESGNPDAEYLSDGVTESLINSLSQLPGLKVISRVSVFRYKGQDVDPQKAASELGVRCIMTGRIVQRGDTLDISVELTDMRDNTQLWGSRFTRKSSDIFAIQDDIARQVTAALRVRLTGVQQEQITKRYTDNVDAYRLYLHGRYFLNHPSEDNLGRALSSFDQAISLDGGYALAYAARGEAFFQMGDLILPNIEAMPKAKQDIATALRIDDKLVEARTTRATIKFQYDWDFPGAEEDFKQVIALNPNHAEAHRQYGWLLGQMGRPMEGVTEMELAQQLDPVNIGIVVDVNAPYYLARQFDQSIAQSRKALEMFPNAFLPHYTMGWASLQVGDYHTGIEELEKAKAIEPTPFIIGTLGYAYARSGRKNDARKLIEELAELSKRRHITPYWIGMIYVGLDEKDQAFAWFEKAYQERSFWLLWLKMDPMVDILRSDPRFRDLTKRIGFPE